MEDILKSQLVLSNSQGSVHRMIFNLLFMKIIEWMFKSEGKQWMYEFLFKLFFIKRERYTPKEFKGNVNLRLRKTLFYNEHGSDRSLTILLNMMIDNVRDNVPVFVEDNIKYPEENKDIILDNGIVCAFTGFEKEKIDSNLIRTSKSSSSSDSSVEITFATFSFRSHKHSSKEISEFIQTYVNNYFNRKPKERLFLIEHEPFIERDTAGNINKDSIPGILQFSWYSFKTNKTFDTILGT